MAKQKKDPKGNNKSIHKVLYNSRFFSGFAIYASLIVRKGSAGIPLLDFLIGNGSYLWFVPVFLVLKFFTRYEPKALFVSLILTISTVVYLQETPIRLLGLNPHLNVFYWAPYLMLGRCYFILEGLIFKIMSLRLIKAVAIVFMIAPFMACIFLANIRLDYFSFDLLFLSFSFFLGASMLLRGAEVSCDGKACEPKRSGFYKFLSNQTLFIYLWHMAFAGVVSRIVGHNFFVLLGTPVLAAVTYFLYIAVVQTKSSRLYLVTGLKPDPA